MVYLQIAVGMLAAGSANIIVQDATPQWKQSGPMVVPRPDPADEARAELPRFTFRDLQVGSVVPKRPADSGFYRCDKISRITSCSYGGVQMAGLPLTGEANYRDGGFYQLQLLFGSGVVDTLKAALTARYGKPCADDVSTVGNSYGAKFERQTLSWCFSDGMAVFQSIAERPNEASFSFLSKAELDRQNPKNPKIDF